MNREELVVKLNDFIFQGQNMIFKNSNHEAVEMPLAMEVFKKQISKIETIDLTEFASWFAQAKNFLIVTLGKESPYVEEFSYISAPGLHAGVRIINSLHILEAVKNDLPANNLLKEALKTGSISIKSRKVFIVHGHDEAMKQTVARFLESLEIEAVILHEKENRGRTIIEKFENNSIDIGFAIVLFSPDDVGYPKNEPEKPQHRPRQNVVFELGYFVGKIGRSNVVVLFKNGTDIEILSDFSGVVYTSFNNGNGWKIDLAKELRAAGIEVDMNKCF